MKIYLSGKNTDGKYAVIDDCDARLATKKWYLSYNGYAVRRFRIPGESKMGIERMHRAVNVTPTGMITDHINGDRLDNRRSNLRTVTHAQNQMNRKPNKNSKFSFPGITLEPNGKYRARVQVSRKKINLGNFDSIDDAISALTIKRKEAGFYA